MVTRSEREQLGPYELLFRLGSGGMAEVFAACVRREGGFEKLVAIKRVLPALAQDPELSSMMLDEARVAANIDSPHVVSSLDVGRTSDGQLYLVMELVVGVPVIRLMQAAAHAKQPLPIPVALEILAQSAAGLHAAHEAVTPSGQRLEVVHRDVSPQNLLVGIDGRVRVSDFGIARAAERVVTTLVPHLKGKLAYASPEQLVGVEDVDRRADVYSLAVVAFELLAGRRLFPRDMNMGAERVRVITPEDVLDARGDTPSGAAFAIARGLAPDRRDRWPTARAFADALLLGGGVAPAGREALGALVQSVAKDEVGRLSESIRGAMGPTRETATPSAPAPTTMRTYTTSFVGREADSEALRAVLLGADRLVTLVGPGGVGKTRLALEVARSLTGSFRGGVRFADLAATHTIEGVCQEVGRALGIPLFANGDQATSAGELGRVLASRPATLILIDNFEHVTKHAPATLARWLAAAPNVTFLVTSRERLRLSAERIHELEPLPTAADGASCPAIQLFVERAASVRRGFALDPQNSAAIADIVAQLEGLPLAIELAASRMRTLEATELARQIATQVEGRLMMFSQGARDAAPRQATLEATIRWSWDLLDPAERAVISRAAVFHRGFDSAAAEGVLGRRDDPFSVADVVDRLIDKSLLRIVQHERTPQRFAMLESVREFAWRELGRLDAQDAAIDAHAAYFARLGERWEREQRTPAVRVLLCQRDYDNLVAAFGAARDMMAPGPERCRALVSIALALEPLLVARGPIKLALQLFRTALGENGNADASVPSVLRVRARLALARVLMAAGRAPEVRAVLAQATTIAAATPEDPIVGWIDLALAEARRSDGDLHGAVADARRAVERAERIGDRGLRGNGLAQLGSAWALLREQDGAQRVLGRALDLSRALGDEWLEARVLATLGDLAADQARASEAHAHLSRAVTLARRVGDATLEAVCLASLGLAALDADEVSGATAHVERGFERVRGAGSRRIEGALLRTLALCTEASGDLLLASQRYEESIEASRRSADALGEGLALVLHGRLLATLGLVTDAEEALARGEALLERVGDPLSLETARLSRGHLELARAWSAEASRDGATATRLRSVVAARLESAQAFALRSRDVRAAVARLTRALGGTPGQP